MVSRRDTRRVAAIRIDSAITHIILDHYDAAQAEGLEAALCVGGSLQGDTLQIERVAGPTYWFRLPRNVGYACPAAPDYLGRLHTHLSFPGGQRAETLPSAVDRLNFWSHEDEVLLLISVGYREIGGEQAFGVFWALRDGREGWFYWPLSGFRQSSRQQSTPTKTMPNCLPLRAGHNEAIADN